MLKSHNHSHPIEKQNKKAETKRNTKGLTKDDFYQAAGYMSMGCWQLPPGCFPFGNWFLF